MRATLFKFHRAFDRASAADGDASANDGYFGGNGTALARFGIREKISPVIVYVKVSDSFSFGALRLADGKPRIVKLFYNRAYLNGYLRNFHGKRLLSFLFKKDKNGSAVLPFLSSSRYLLSAFLRAEYSLMGFTYSRQLKLPASRAVTSTSAVAILVARGML